MNEPVFDSAESHEEANESASDSRCPMREMLATRPKLQPDDELIIPHHKRAITVYSQDDDGETALQIRYGDKGMLFNNPELFAFGENFAKQSQFVAKTAMTWGEGYDWADVQELLEFLLEEGILQHAIQNGDDPMTLGLQTSPLPPSSCTEPRSWFDCEVIMLELTGHSLELGYLEAVVPIYRVAHIAVDADDRQVGEANVYPSALRLDAPTDWRRCPYPGSRYQDEFPMNVTALRSMNKFWKPIMVVLQRIRNAYLNRYPQARNGWTVGDLQRLSTLVLALPTYLLMRTENPVANGSLHPVLSSMFRITDGVRMTMQEMLFTPVMEPIRPAHAPMTSDELYDYAERNNVFLSGHGVCAGPKTLIQEFLRIFIDGKPIQGLQDLTLDADVQTALDAFEPAFDYGLYGLQTYAAVFSLWPMMSRTYACLIPQIEACSGAASSSFTALRDRLRQTEAFLSRGTYLANEEWRQSRERGLQDIYDQCANGLNARAGAPLAEQLQPLKTARHIETASHLFSILQQRFYGPTATDHSGLEKVVDILMDYFRREQAIVRTASESQQRINHLLGRTPPTRPLLASHISLYYQLLEEDKRLPYLVSELEETLGLRVVVSRDAIDIVDLSTL